MFLKTISKYCKVKPILIFIFCHNVIFTFGFGQNSQNPAEHSDNNGQPHVYDESQNAIKALERKVANAGLSEVRKIASTCFQQLHNSVENMESLRHAKEVDKTAKRVGSDSESNTLYYFNKPMNHYVNTESLEDDMNMSTDIDIDLPNPSRNNKPQRGSVTSKPKSMSSSSDNGKSKSSRSKDSSEEDDDRVPGYAPNPGIIDSNNKPPKKQDGGGNNNSKHPGGKVIFEETFSDRNWDSKWMYTKYAGNGTEKFEKFFRVRSKPRQSGKPLDYGIMTSNKGAEDYAVATTFSPLNSNDGNLVIQFSIQYQTKPYCENTYLRLFDCKFRPEDFNPETPYLIQLGPNFCGVEKNELSVEVLDPFKSERKVINQQIKAVTSKDLHIYAFLIEPGGTYQILTNNTQVQNGTLKDSFPNFQGFPSICSVGLSVWHSVLDKFFKGQIIIDDILISTDVDYAEKKRSEILQLSTEK